MPPRDTLIDFFRDLATIRGEFLVYDDGYRRRAHTYEAVGRGARGFAARLAAAGLRKGDKVVFWGENRPEWIACYWGCLISGVIVVPVDYRSGVDFVERVAALVDAKLLLVGEDVHLPPEGGSHREPGTAGGSHREPGTAGGRRPEPVASGFPPSPGYGGRAEALRAEAGSRKTEYFHDFDWQADGPMPAVEVSRDDVAQIIFTSGATAEPKGVVIRHRNVMANIVPVEREIEKYRKYARPVSPLRFVNLLPLSHMFGLSLATNVPPMVRGTVIFTRSFNPHDIVRLVRARRVSVLVCVPKILDVLREHVVRAFPEAAEAPPAGISIPGRWWRYRRVHRALGLKFWAFVVGAAPLPPELEEFWRRMGFAVIQGYGLTETAPIVTLNHPFKTSKGSVGTPIAGVEIRIADDGEILVRGENVTSGYYTADSRLPAAGAVESPVDAEGWLHTGDIGELDAQRRVFIKGRKKEMIVTPEGLNVFPEDVERVLDETPGVRESAVVGVAEGAQERVHAVLLLEPGADTHAIVRAANARLQDHQRIRAASVWPDEALPRTEGTRKLKRRAIRDWVAAGERPLAPETGGDSVEALIARFTRGRDVSGATTLEELGLSSLERVELMVALEDRFQTRIDETRVTESASIADLKQLVEQPAAAAEVEEPVDFPSWNRSWPVHLVRRLSLATWILPMARLFARVQVEGLEHLARIEGPVVFAANHQSHMDLPVILLALPGRWRARVAPAMLKEFFKAHFNPADHTWRQWFTNSLNYYLACFYFNAFPIPQREAGTRQTLRYIGELTSAGSSVLIFPEGVRAATGDIKPFRGGVGMIASRLELPVVPVRLDGVDRLLPASARFVRFAGVRVAFGAPLHLHGDDYAALAREVEVKVRTL